MSTRFPHSRVLLFGFVLVSTAIVAAQSPQQPPVFRSSTALVPVDVRVLDKSGKPITDLKAADFTVFEDGVKQDVKFFSADALTPGLPENAPIRRTSGTAATLAAQNRRLFLIVLGRGRLNRVSKGVDAVLAFVRTRLAPQDQVAVMAWNRATEFSANHERIAQVLERFSTQHEQIEYELFLQSSGLRGLYGSQTIEPATQAKINAVFGTAPSRAILADTRRSSGTQRTAEDLLTTASGDPRSEMYRQLGSDLRLNREMSLDSQGMSFDDYVSLNRQTMQDVGNLYAGVDYLRFIEGEKHLLFVTEQGLLLPSADMDRDLAAMAADARIAIDTIQVGGVAVSSDPAISRSMGGAFAPTTLPGAGPMVAMTNGFALSTLRTLSETTGGQVSTSSYADKAIDRIVHSTDFGYLLGYTPTKTAADGSFRKISVKVARSGASVSFRRGYFARPTVEKFDPRVSLANTRLIGAMNYGGEVSDLKVTISATEAKTETAHVLKVDAVVNITRMNFARVNGQHMAAVSFATVVQDEHGKEIGAVWKTIDVSISPADFPRITNNGLRITVPVPIALKSRANVVRFVIYDYGSDLLGSITGRIR